MHLDEVDVDEALVHRLLRRQLPALAGFALTPVEAWGTDHAIWRVGEELVVRLPRVHWADGQAALEARWLPVLAEHLPVRVPEVVAIGEPALGYPFRWSVPRWFPGESAAIGALASPERFALDLAEVLARLRDVPVRGAPAARHRARPLHEYDRATRSAIAGASALIDAEAAVAVWEDALAAEPLDGPPGWVHGDLDANCLLVQGRLGGIIDWGSACAGDPAVDVQVVWSPLFSAESRRQFVVALAVDDDTLRRSRGAALHQACAALPYYLRTHPAIVERSRRKLDALGVRVTGTT